MARHTRDDEFRAFFTAEGPRLERFATMLVGDPFQGADLTQEALVRAYARWGRIRNGFPAAYVHQTILNLVRSAHRSSKLRATKPMPSWARSEDRAPAPDDLVGESLRLIDALKTLPPTRRAALVLRFYEDMAEQDIAQVLDRPLGTIKSDIHRGLKQLRPLLEDTGSKGRTR